MLDSSEELSVKNITNKLNEQYERDSDRLSPHRVGRILSDLTLVKKRSGRKGAYVIDTSASSRTLELLRKQYGISDEHDEANESRERVSS
jgi:hypothetical protein